MTADNRNRIGRTAAWAALCVAALVVVVAISLSPGRTTPSGTVPAPAAMPAPAATPAPATTAAPSGARAAPVPSAAAAWARFKPAADILVRAEEVLELRGLMTRDEGPDNKGLVTASGEPARVAYVWCKDDGHAEKDKDKETGPPEVEDHSAVFSLTVPETRLYYPWARVWWEDSCGNSIFVVLEREGQKVQEYVVQDGTCQWWHWLPVGGESGLQLERGTYRLTVRNREDGARLSRILFCAKSYAVYKPETPEG